MSFLAPFALTLFALSVPLVLLYFLKVRRRERTVSSLLLWHTSLRDREASTFFQRLHRDPLLLLQLLALLALALALARPVATVMGQGARKVVVVLDISASMKERDVSPSRFEVARSGAASLVRGLGEGAEVMVIEAGVQPKVTAALARDRERALAAIRAAQPRDLPTRVQEAVRTARALVAAEPRAEIHVFTDGAYTLPQSPDVSDPRVRWVGVGRRSQNVAITGLSVRKNYYGAFDYQAFVSLVNYSIEPQTFSFRLELEGKSIAEKEVTLEPNVRRSVVLPFSHSGGGTVTARLRIDDDLAVDNTAYAVLPPPRKIAVLLVSAGNLFLEKVLRTDPQVSLEVRTPDQYQGGMGDADVVVLDSVTPPRAGPGRFVFVNAVPPDVPLEVLGRLERPTIMDWDRAHPVMRHVEFAKVTIEDAMRIRPLAAGRPVVEAVGGPLIYALEEPDRKALFVGFDLFKTDFPLRIAFPLVLSNTLRWLHPAGLDQSSFQFAAGQPILLPAPHGVTTVTVTTPSGRVVQGRVTRGMVSFTETDETGIYTLSTSRGETRVAVNLADADESNLVPHPLPAASEHGPAAAPVPVQRELWPLFVILAVVLLAGEGLLYWRRQSAGRLRAPAGVGDRWALALRSALVVVLCLALLRPTLPRWVDRMNVVFLLDLSDSVSLASRERAYRFVAEAGKHMKSGDRNSVIAFGDQAVVDQPLASRPAIERPKAQVDGRGTNIFQAIQLSLAMLPPGQANRIIMLTDGQQNAGNALAGAQAAKDAGADIYYVPAPLTFTHEVVAEAMVLPHEVKFGEPFQAKVVVWSHRDTEGRLSLFRNGEFLGSQVVRLTAGKNVFSYRQSLDASGIHVYQAAMEVEGDTIEENNRAVGAVVVRGRPQVLLADRDRTHAQSLAGALRSQNIDVTVVEPQQIPTDLAGLQKYDGVILSNVSSLKLTRAQMTMIRDYVRDQGGGLIMVGGEESFGLGGYYRTPIEEALPVTMEVKQKVEIPSLAVVLSIDRSGSMAMSTGDEKVTKLDLAKEASHLVVDLLDDRNEVGVMSWDTEFIWDVAMRSARDKAAIHHAIATIKAGGGTDGYPALKESYAILFERPALLKHVIFLSDGQMTRGDFAGLLRRMAKDKITVSTVAIGKDADLQLMVDIAKWGRGRFYYTEDSQTIPRILTLETQQIGRAHV